MIEIIKSWTSSKETKEFNYERALETLIKDKSIVNQSINDYLHFNFSNHDIKEKLEEIGGINQNHINSILDLINEYTYYLEMNEILKFQDDKNTKKLKQLNKILDDDFIDFLNRYIDLDKTILSSNDSLKIVNDYQDVIQHYLKYDFKFAINELDNFFNKNKVRSDSIEIKEKNKVNSLLIKPKTNAYLTSIGKRGILKCLYFDLLYYFKDITKEQSINIIEEFFNIYFTDEKIKVENEEKEFRVLQDKKSDHTLSIETIDFIRENTNIYNLKKDTPTKIQKEIKKILNIKDSINDNFIPIYTTKDI